MRLLLRPGWILTHLGVVAIAVLFIALGMWQLDRHAETQQDNVRIAASQQAAPLPLAEAMALEDPDLQPATVTGAYLVDADVRLSPRSRNQLPGFEVLTPLRLADGRALLVNRGWVPLDDPIPPPPTGAVALDGRLRLPARAPQVLPPDGPTVELMSNPDLEVLTDQVPGLIDDVYLEVIDEAARQAGAVPRPAEPIALDAGNHLSYAMQWFAFTVIGLIGYPLLLRRRMTDERDPGRDPDDDAPPGPGGDPGGESTGGGRTSPEVEATPARQ